MRTFLKAVDELVWLAVTDGWKPPTITVDGNETLKLPKNWTKEEQEASGWNSKAMNILFNSLPTKEFRRSVFMRLLKRHGIYLKSLMKALQPLRLQNFKG